MRKEVYEMLIEKLSCIYRTPDGGYDVLESGKAVPEGWERAIKHIDLWNHNVEFIEQEEQWERPAVFVEFLPIQWEAAVHGVEYRTEATVNLHVVTDWQGSSAADSEFREASLRVFDLLDAMHSVLSCRRGVSYLAFDLSGSQTNHNHDEMIEMIESYGLVGVKRL